MRAGLGRGELVALHWGDIQFGSSESDRNRYLLVRNNYVARQFTTPKSKKTRRVDLSRQLRSVLLEIRDRRMLLAFIEGKSSILEELAFPSPEGSVLDPDNLVKRYFLPTIEHAGLRRFRFHDLRHTFGSLLIQGGASLAYVREQMGHSSIQVTVDTYGHLIPGADVNWVDRLDAAADLPGPGRLRTQFEPARSERSVESLSTGIGRCRRGLEVRPICTLPEAAHVGTRNVQSPRNRFCFCDRGYRYFAASGGTCVPDDRGGCAV